MFAGFKPNSDIEALFNLLDPLKRFLPDNRLPFNDESVKAVCRNILNASDETIKETQKALQEISRETFGNQDYILDLLPRLQEQYSIEDPGNLVALLYVTYGLPIATSNLPC